MRVAPDRWLWRALSRPSASTVPRRLEKRAHVAPIAHLSATDFDRPHPGLDCSMRPMAMTHDAVAAIRQFQVLPHSGKGVGFRDQHLGQHAASAFTCKFAQRIVDGLRLTEGDDSGISRHGSMSNHRLDLPNGRPALGNRSLGQSDPPPYLQRTQSQQAPSALALLRRVRLC
jgi:hypothetical protein